MKSLKNFITESIDSQVQSIILKLDDEFKWQLNNITDISGDTRWVNMANVPDKFSKLIKYECQAGQSINKDLTKFMLTLLPKTDFKVINYDVSRSSQNHIYLIAIK